MVPLNLRVDPEVYDVICDIAEEEERITVSDQARVLLHQALRDRGRMPNL